MKDFIVLIISHKRANNVKTLRSLANAGFTGNWKIVLDDLDPTIADYEELYPGRIEVFEKQKYGKLTDSGDNFNLLNSPTYARNACFDIAERLGFKYFLVLDDDYTVFHFRFNSQLNYGHIRIRNIDNVFENFFEFIEFTKVDCIAFSQGGDFIGGQGSSLGKSISTKRKVMQTFFCSTERRFQFVARLNEDVTTYCILGSRGKVFLTFSQVSLEQGQTQSNPGGLTEAYLEAGTYVKSFYTTMFCPSFAKVQYDVHMRRIHHRISWKNAVPKILSEAYKKS